MQSQALAKQSMAPRIRTAKLHLMVDPLNEGRRSDQSRFERFAAQNMHIKPSGSCAARCKANPGHPKSSSKRTGKRRKSLLDPSLPCVVRQEPGEKGCPKWSVVGHTPDIKTCILQENNSHYEVLGRSCVPFAYAKQPVNQIPTIKTVA